MIEDWSIVYLDSRTKLSYTPCYGQFNNIRRCAMNASDFCRSLTPKYVTVDGVRTHYVECGRGPTVILLHGLSASLWNWWRTIPTLADRYHVVAYDLKGFGNSVAARGQYTAESCATQLVGLMNHLHVDRAALVAHSMGTRVALASALLHPDRVRALVLTSPSCYPQTAGRPVSLMVLPGIGELYTSWAFSRPLPTLVRSTLRGCMHPRSTLHDDDVYWNMRAGSERAHQIGRVYLGYGRHMRFHKPWHLARRYSEIQAPTLIISGDSDRLVPVQHPQQLAHAIAHARLELWPHTGHLPHVEHADRFNRTLRAFLGTTLRTERARPSRLLRLVSEWRHTA